MKIIPAVMALVMREEERPNVGVVTCEDGEEGRGEEGGLSQRGRWERREGEGGRREAGEHCLSSSSCWGELLSGPYCEIFPLMGPHPL